MGMRTLPEGLRIWNPAILLATWFGTGVLPRAPGTWGSAAALPFAWAIHTAFGWQGLALASILVFGIGVWASEVYVRQSGAEDPGPVVIDEVVGQWLVLIPVAPDLLHYLVGFALFRLFDITKPWPVSWADRNVKGGLGVMLDDVLAAIYGAIILSIVAGYWGGL